MHSLHSGTKLTKSFHLSYLRPTTEEQEELMKFVSEAVAEVVGSKAQAEDNTV